MKPDASQFKDDPIGYVEGFLKQKWTPQQKQVAQMLMARTDENGNPLRNRGRVMVLSGHNTGKCVAASEYMTLATGERVKAGDLVGDKFSLMTLLSDNETGFNKVQSVEARAEFNAIEPVYTITTESGRKIVRNAQHPLYAANAKLGSGIKSKITPKGWTPLIDIHAGDLVAITKQLPVLSTEFGNDKTIKLLAYLTGDGGYTQHQVVWTQENNKQMEEFKTCLDQFDCEINYKSNYDWCVVGKERLRTKGANGVINLLRRHGLMGKHSRDKFIPEWIFTLKNSDIALFLNRLFSTDGWACVGKSGNPEIGFCSASEQLVRDVQDLLVRFGIPSRIRERKDVKAWVLNINDCKNIVEFTYAIGIYGKEEAIEKVRERAKAMKPGKGSVWRWKTAPRGTYWEKVVSVECTGIEATIGIEVPEHHTYLTQFYEHNTHQCGGIVNWFYETRNPGLTLTTAPNFQQVNDVVWKEVRRQRRALGAAAMGEVLPRAPRMLDSEAHMAVGYTSGDSAGFQGRKEGGGILVVFEEATGIEGEIWTATESMVVGDDAYWICYLNPTDTASMAAKMTRDRRFQVIELSCLQHPNVLRGVENLQRYQCGLDPLPLDFPAANLRLEWVLDKMLSWCAPISYEARTPIDFSFPIDPETMQIVEYGNEDISQHFWFRPTPQGESRLLGRWPSQSEDAVWSSAMWNAAWRNPEYGYKPDVESDTEVEIGCDVARGGTDYTTFIVRRGSKVLDHKRFNGWATDRTAGYLKELATKWGHYAGQPPESVSIKIDDTGVGGGVVDQKGRFNFIGITAASLPVDQEHYPNRRSELWFTVAERANEFQVDLSGYGVSPELPKSYRDVLEAQLLSAKWKQDSRGRRVVEPKAETKKRLKESPDDADALNLAFAPASRFNVNFTEGAMKMLARWNRG
jgi:intein/homing endonuclease